MKPNISFKEIVASAVETAVETVLDSYKEKKEDLSPYEIERNKPMPNFIHGALQTEISFLLKLNYREKYMCVSELSLATNPGSTPDICIYPLRKLDINTVKAKEDKPPITTIEIQSPSQSIEQMENKVLDIYFPFGVQSAWIVYPRLKAIQILLPNGQKLFFNSGTLKDPVTNIELDLEKVFAVLG